MFRLVCSLALLAVLSACGPGTATHAYRANTSPAQADRDNFQCEVEATRTVPVNTQVRYEPGYWTPSRRICDSDGANCRILRGDYIPGYSYTVDRNQGLRREYLARCLAGRGYALSVVERCPRGTEARGDLARALVARLRPAREGACAVTISDRSTNLIYAEERG